MPHEIHASIVIRLEEAEAKEWTSALSVVAAQWATFLSAVEPLHGVAHFEVSETKGKAPNGARQRRTRVASTASDGAELMASLS
jgi:hypothetical protein